MQATISHYTGDRAIHLRSALSEIDSVKIALHNITKAMGPTDGAA